MTGSRDSAQLRRGIISRLVLIISAPFQEACPRKTMSWCLMPPHWTTVCHALSGGMADEQLRLSTKLRGIPEASYISLDCGTSIRPRAAAGSTARSSITRASSAARHHASPASSATSMRSSTRVRCRRTCNRTMAARSPARLFRTLPSGSAASPRPRKRPGGTRCRGSTRLLRRSWSVSIEP